MQDKIKVLFICHGTKKIAQAKNAVLSRVCEV